MIALHPRSFDRGAQIEDPAPLEALVAYKRTAHTLDLNEVFLFEAKRKVQKDRTVSLHGVVYEVDAALVGQNVTLRYDPAAPPGRPVQVWHEGQPIQLATSMPTPTASSRASAPPERSPPAPQRPSRPRALRFEILTIPIPTRSPADVPQALRLHPLPVRDRT